MAIDFNKLKNGFSVTKLTDTKYYYAPMTYYIGVIIYQLINIFYVRTLIKITFFQNIFLMFSVVVLLEYLFLLKNMYQKYENSKTEEYMNGIKKKLKERQNGKT